ncbi:MAG: molybdate ABC transporter substrate-binding protein, partial [Polyangiaceae bacterium]
SKAIYAVGRIVLFSAPGATLAPQTVRDLADPRITKIAIANPSHAPFGRAAREAMQHAGVWTAVSRKIVEAENVQQALRFTLSGNVDVGVVSLSLATASPGRWALVPSDLHAPIDQALVVCSNGRAGTAAGRRFAAFVGSTAGRAIMQKYGLASSRLP